MIDSPLDKVNEYIQHRQARESEILLILDQPRSSREITKMIYATYPKDILVAAEKSVLLHLEKLVLEGKVVQNEEKYSVNKKQ